MAKYLVQAVNRPGFDGYFRANRKWPSSAPTEVEVVDAEEDPPQKEGGAITIGQKSLKALKADMNLRVNQGDDPQAMARASGDTEALQRRIAELEAENRRLKGEREGGETQPTRRRA